MAFKMPTLPDMDFVGQGLAERCYQYIIVAFTAAGFVAGYVRQDFQLTFNAWLVGFVVAAVVSLPPWPCFRRHPVKWLAAEEGVGEAVAHETAPGQGPASKPPAGKGSSKKAR